MTTLPRPVPSGSSARIKQRQDRPEHLQRLMAYSHLYRTAQRWHRARAFGTFVLATVAPIVSLLVPSTSDILAAIAAGWLVVGRTILSWLEEHGILHAVSVQELYDTRLFKLPWNTALVGRQPAPEDVAAAAAHFRNDTGYRNWYSIDLGDTPWPGDVLLCQRMSMIWSRRDHRAYGTTILITGIAWFALGLAVALARDLSLASYLIKIFLPSSPALLDCTELARSHWRHATRREHASRTSRTSGTSTTTTRRASTPPHAATSRTPHTSCVGTDRGYPASSTSSAARHRRAISAGAAALLAGPEQDT